MIAAVSSAMGKFPIVASGQMPHCCLSMESSDRMSGNTSALRTWPRSIPSSLRIWSGARNYRCNQNKRKESYRSCNLSQPHTQALYGFFSASVSFFHFSPDSLFTTFECLVPASAAIAARFSAT
jgi:hypothetical protein